MNLLLLCSSEFNDGELLLETLNKIAAKKNISNICLVQEFSSPQLFGFCKTEDVVLQYSFSGNSLLGRISNCIKSSEIGGVLMIAKSDSETLIKIKDLCENSYKLPFMTVEFESVNSKFEFFHTAKHPFSNMYPCKIRDDLLKLDFHCTEQLFQFYKARFFKDKLAMVNIKSCEDGKAAKEFGREVQNFDAEKWNLKKFSCMKYVNGLKFAQNPKLAEKLLATGEKTLAESSKTDRIWGIGMTASCEGVDNPDNWTGENLMGKVLMEIREELKKEQAN